VPSVTRLLEAGLRLGATTFVLNPDELTVERGPAAASRGVLLRGVDGASILPPGVVLPRMGSISGEYSIAVVRAFEAAGFRVINSASALLRVRNKVTALIELSAAGIPVLPFCLLRHPADVERAAERLGGFPVMVKFIRGTQGLGVMKAGDAGTAVAILSAFNALGFDVYLERFYSPRHSRDARILVAGGRILGAMERVRSRHDYRASIHLGAKPRAYEPSDEERGLALRAAKFFGLELCGVDFLRTREGVFVLEVNASPGLTGISEAMQRDLAEDVLRLLLRRRLQPSER